MPDGNPLFPIDVVETLNRNGISLQEAERDFERARDVETSEGGDIYRYGILCIYRYRRQLVMGRPEAVVTRVWIVR